MDFIKIQETLINTCNIASVEKFHEKIDDKNYFWIRFIGITGECFTAFLFGTEKERDTVFNRLSIFLNVREI